MNPFVLYHVLAFLPDVERVPAFFSIYDPATMRHQFNNLMCPLDAFWYMHTTFSGHTAGGSSPRPLGTLMQVGDFSDRPLRTLTQVDDLADLYSNANANANANDV